VGAAGVVGVNGLVVSEGPEVTVDGLRSSSAFTIELAGGADGEGADEPSFAWRLFFGRWQRRYQSQRVNSSRSHDLIPANSSMLMRRMSAKHTLSTGSGGGCHTGGLEPGRAETGVWRTGTRDGVPLLSAVPVPCEGVPGYSILVACRGKESLVSPWEWL